jgi:hypothetical protein
MLTAQLRGSTIEKLVSPRSSFRLAGHVLEQEGIELAEYEDGVWWADGKRFVSLVFDGPVVLQFEEEGRERELFCDAIRITDGAIRSGHHGENLVARFVEAERAWQAADGGFWADVVILPCNMVFFGGQTILPDEA